MIYILFYRNRRQKSQTPKDAKEISEIKNTTTKGNTQNLSSSNIYEHSSKNKRNKVKLNSGPKCHNTDQNGTELKVMKETEVEQNPVYSTFV